MDTKRNHQISVDKAAEMTRKYRENRPDQFAICETFDLDAVMQLLSNPDCRFLRIYYGMDESNNVHAILVGANAKEEDILPGEPATTEGGSGVLEDGFRCPQYCPPASKLNS